MKWIRSSERLPGMNKIVKWRNADGGNIPLGENTFLDQYKKIGPNISWHEWLDESESQPSYTKEQLIKEIGNAWEAAIEFCKQEERSVVNSDIKAPDKQSYINNLEL